MMTRLLCLFLLLCATFGTEVQAQKRGKRTNTHKVAELSPEELLAKEWEEALAKRMDEMLENTRQVTFIDSLVVNKDEFLSQLRLTTDAGQFKLPQTLFADDTEREMGQAAYVNPLSSVVYFSVADTTGNLQFHAAYRSGRQWSVPAPLNGLDGFVAQDFPFLHSDGTTLYFSAEGDESIGGRDIFATRYNAETGRYVLPFNMGFPFNSTANDYLLAIDESAGIGVLVSDRHQPDDKVCLYWFLEQDNYETYELDPEDEDEGPQLLALAQLTSIADTQTDADLVRKTREQWHEALAAQSAENREDCRFVVNDAIVYHALDQFASPQARALASQWLDDTRALQQVKEQLDDLRSQYANLRSERLAQSIRNMEVQSQQLQSSIRQLAKQFRQAEQQHLRQQPRQ